MDYRSPVQHLLQKMLPTHASMAAQTEDFADTRPDDRQALPPADAPPRKSAPSGASPFDPFPGTEVMEYPDETAAELLDEFFAQPGKRAA